MSGTLCKKTLGSGSGSLIHVIAMEHTADEAGQFFNNVQTVINNWLLIEGHSIGIVDTLRNEDADKSINEIIEKAEEEFAEAIKDPSGKRHKNVASKNIRETFESTVNGLLNKARDDAGKTALKSLSKFNNFKLMVVSGAKGSNINIAQVVACVGQQNVEGKRIGCGFQKRTLPHFSKFDCSPEAKGFVKNSYLSGLTPTEFYFHAMAGREGVIDTAIKTAETGYIQRKLIKSMESVMVQYDGTVRDQTGGLVQLIYGEDGYDGAFVEFQQMPTFLIDNYEFERRFRFDINDEKFFIENFSEDVIDSINYDSNAMRILEEEWEVLIEDRNRIRDMVHHSTGGKIPLPANIRRILSNAQSLFKIDVIEKSNLSPLTTIREVRKLCGKLEMVKGDDSISLEANEGATSLLKCLIRSELSAKNIILNYRLTPEALDWVLVTIATEFNRAFVNYGEMVGALAAESIGEPATQMTLNTFHHAGVSAKNVTLGVPRLKEILSVSKSPKTPSLRIFLNKDISQNQEKVLAIGSELEFMTLRKCVMQTEIYYDSNMSDSNIIEDREWLQLYNELEPKELNKWSSFVLKIKFNRKALMKHHLKLEDIGDIITEQLKEEIHCVVPNQLLSCCIMIRQKIGESNDKGEIGEYESLQLLEKALLDKINIKGILNISKTYLHEVNGEDSYKRFKINQAGIHEQIKEWILETDGSSLQEVLIQRHVDQSNTTTNHITEIYNILGIEAARNAVENELRHVLSFDGSYVNSRHISLLCGIMTNQGSLMSIDRHGINRQDTGPLVKCSFEETVDMFLNAACNAESDPINGVSESIFLGQMAKIGTGCFDILLDVKEAEMEPLIIQGSDRKKDPGIYGANTPSQGLSSWISPSSPFHMGSYGSALSPKLQSNSYSSVSQSIFSPIVNPMTPNAMTSSYNHSSSGYKPTSPSYSLSSPGYNPTSPGYSPTSPAYSPTSPGYSPTSPAYSPTSHGYSPTSPAYRPTSPGYSLTSPVYSPTSPGYSPTSPAYSPTNRGYSPTNLAYSPSSPNYSPTSPAYSPSSPAYSPTSPAYSPSSPAYFGTNSPYSPSIPKYCPTSPAYSSYNQNMAQTKDTNNGPSSPNSSKFTPRTTNPPSSYQSYSTAGQN